MMSLIRNKTPLTAIFGLTDDEIIRLRNNWINTWEEYCAYAHACSDVDFAGKVEFEKIIGHEAFSKIMNAPDENRPVGCVVPDASVQSMMTSYRNGFSKDGDFDDDKSFLDDGLPHEIRLMEEMPPIRDQGERGTCSAFASVALLEFKEHCSMLLSPQFLYWAGKERDALKNSDGLSLDVIQNALFEDGACEESIWPYKSECVYYSDGRLNPGQGPAPESAVENAKQHKLLCRTLTPRAVRQYREILSLGKPIVVGLAVFDSWVKNPFTAETGKVPMPLIMQDENGEWQLREKFTGGYAMCLVGYVDDESVPGGGYFIVRNSWGVSWARECEEGGGHALIPYRYIAMFAFSAYTMLEEDEISNKQNIKNRNKNQTSGMSVRAAKHVFPGPCNLKPFATKLAADMREFSGRLCAAGSWVVSLSQPGSPVVEWNNANFGTPEYLNIWAASRFPVKELWSDSQKSLYDEILSLKQNFVSNIEDNFSKNALLFKSFPEFNFSWTKFRIIESSRIGTVKVEADDFSDILFNKLIDSAKVENNEKDVAVSDIWRETLKTTFFAKILRVSNISLCPTSVYVVAVFATPFGMDKETGTYHFVNPSALLIETVKDCATQVLKGKAKRDFVFYSIGTGLPGNFEKSVFCDGHSTITLSFPRMAGKPVWEVRRPEYLTGQSAYRDFCDRLMPITQNNIVSAIKSYVDEVFRECSEDSFRVCKVTVDEIIEHLHGNISGDFGGFPRFRRTTVIRALLQMQGNDSARYAVCKNVNDPKEIFVIPRAEILGDRDKKYKSRGWLPNLLLYHSIDILGFILSATIFVGRSVFLAKMGLNDSAIVAIIFVAITMYISGLIQRRFNYALSSIEKD